MSGKVSAVLLSWRRRGNLGRIVERLRSMPWVDDITIWDNEPGGGLRAADVGATRIFSSLENIWTFGRFRGLGLADHDTVYVQDDDVLPNHLPDLWHAWTEGNGLDLTTAMPRGHISLHERYRWGTAHEVLVGWGAIFDKRWVVPALRGYLREYGADGILSRKADRLFTLLMNRPHCVIEADYKELPGARDKATALYHRGDHQPLNATARIRALELLGIPRAEWGQARWR